MIREFFWRIVAFIVTRPSVTRWLIARAVRTPYYHIIRPDGSLYMERWWLLNPYPALSDGGGTNRGLRGWMPSVRIHHIVQPDTDDHLHDHPWNARTIILRGWYGEERPSIFAYWPADSHSIVQAPDCSLRYVYTRTPGYTGQLLFGQYHRISEVSEGGVWTLFITWKKHGTWGFFVDGKKVPWREYLGIPKGGEA